jgi:hypothetical protein
MFPWLHCDPWVLLLLLNRRVLLPPLRRGPQSDPVDQLCRQLLQSQVDQRHQRVLEVQKLQQHLTPQLVQVIPAVQCSLVAPFHLVLQMLQLVQVNQQAHYYQLNPWLLALPVHLAPQ